MSNKKFYADDEKSKIARHSAANKKKSRKSSKILNKSFVEKKIKSEPNLEEAAMNIQRFELERSSTPNIDNICEHCSHNHAQVSKK